MKRAYFGTKYKWDNQKHEEGKTRAHQLFKYGKIKVGSREIRMDMNSIQTMLQKGLIKEVS